MRSILKASTLESKFPIMTVEHGCIVSKDADITVAFRVTLPEVFSVSSADYEAMHAHERRQSRYCRIFQSSTNRIFSSRRNMSRTSAGMNRASFPAVSSGTSTKDPTCTTPAICSLPRPPGNAPGNKATGTRSAVVFWCRRKSGTRKRWSASWKRWDSLKASSMTAGW